MTGGWLDWAGLAGWYCRSTLRQLTVIPSGPVVLSVLRRDLLVRPVTTLVARLAPLLMRIEDGRTL